jgi:nitrogen fixation protein NifB
LSAPIIPIIQAGRPTRQDPAAGCGGSSGCGSTAGRAVPDAVRDQIRAHPCYSEEAHGFFARMHVAVAPACNIQCHYCNRKYDCSNESRPGVVSERLTPEQAADKVAAVAARMPQLSVVGIAGPGDALADPERTFETLRRLRDRQPDLILCLSTNGLALPDHVDTLVELGVRHVTVTVNAVDPAIGAKIYPWIAYEGRRITGVEAARILRDRQMAGIEALAKAGVLIKINSVMIPGINDQHLVEVNAWVRARGAFLHNVMPLISDPRHGTHFGLTGQRAPTPAELKALQDTLSVDARIMRHCRQCRADAIGLLGEECADLGPDDGGAVAPPVDDEARSRYRDVADGLMDEQQSARTTAELRLKSMIPETSELIAICTRGGGRINQHFGHAKEFQIYEAGPDGIHFVGHRRIERYCNGDGDDDALETIIEALDGVGTVLCAKVGRCPSERLAEAGITVRDDFAFDYIETAIAGLIDDRTGRNQMGARSA